MSGKRLVLLAFLALAALQLASPPDLFRGDQAKQVGYVMDILHGGRLVLQYEVNGQVATKPPLYNWVAAGICAGLRTTGPWAMKLPSLAACAGLLCILYSTTRRSFGDTAAVWAVWTALTAHHMVKLMWFARTDMVMAFLLHLAIWLTVRLRASWWKPVTIGVVLGASFLTKGPVAPCLYALWVLGDAWLEGRLGNSAGWRRAAVGAAVCLGIAVVWLVCVWDMPGFQETVLGKELGGRLVGARARSKPFYYYVPYLVARIFPWSLVAAWAWWTRRSDAGDGPAVRALGLWALSGLVFFSCIPVKRHDLLLPVYLPVFVLAGRGVQRLVAAVPATVLRRVLLCVCAGGALYGLVAPVLRFSSAMLCVAAALVALAAAGWRWRHTPQRLSVATLCSVMLIHGTYQLGVGKEHEIDRYARLRAYADPLRGPAARGQVALCDVHPLLSYELGLHEIGVTPAQALARNPRVAVVLVDSENIDPGPLLDAGAVPDAPFRIEGTGVDMTPYRLP